jgi:hypothetical protein
MENRSKVWILTIVLWTIILVVYPFFYSDATGNNILTQGDLVLALATFLIIGIGLRLNSRLFTTLNFIWGTMTLTWILVASISRLISKTRMEIIDAVYTRMLFVVNEWWIIALLTASGLVTTYSLSKNLMTNILTLTHMGQRTKTILTVVSVAIPVLWCLTLNLRS